MRPNQDLQTGVRQEVLLIKPEVELFTLVKAKFGLREVELCLDSERL